MDWRWVLGLTYKGGTSTLRRSAAIEIIKELLELNIKVKAHDPCVSYIDSIQDKNFQLCDSAYSAAEDVDVLLILTDWKEFREIDYEKIFAIMKKPLIFDMKNILDENILKNIGFDYKRVNWSN